MSNWSRPVEGNSPGFIDRAETFAESDVTVTHTDTQVSGESVGLISGTSGEQATFGTTSGEGGGDEYGTVINPNTTLGGVSVNWDGSISGDTAYLERVSDGTILDSAPASGSNELTAELVAGTEYAVYRTPSGSLDASEYFDTTNGANADFDVVSGWDAGKNGNHAFGVDAVTALLPVNSGSVIVEWPEPTDLYGWDTAQFQRTLEGESVEVFVEESTDGGSTWTEVAGPVARGDGIPTDAADQMRFRVDFSRTSPGNDPTLDAIYRRYTV